MKCYNHHDRDAFGVCRSCGKALCLECMSKDSGNVVCANDLTCLNKDRQTENMYKNAEKIYSKENVKRSKWMAITFIIVAIVFSIPAIMSFDIFSAVMALFFFSAGIVLFIRAKEVQAQD